MAAMPETLGDFLRARREQLTPEAVGLPAGQRRRVRGLRREEVAMLAGISTEYYLRLEQGRDLHPSDQVLVSVSRALRLDEDAVAYLHRLAHPAPSAHPRRTPRRTTADGAGAQLQQLLDSWPLTPAHVQDPSGLVVAANRLAGALNPHFGVGRNPLRAAFLEPDMRQLYLDWEEVTAKTVAGLRTRLTTDSAEPELLEVIGELCVHSERFRTLWARRDVRVRTSGLTLLDHPVVGRLDLRYEKMALLESRQLMVIYHAEPGSRTAESLRLLTTL